MNFISRREETPMTQVTPEDPLSAEIERALFKRFWVWLGIVGSVVIVAVSAISVLVSNVVVYTAKDEASKQIAELKEQLKDLRKTAMDSAIATGIAQSDSEKSAKASKTAATEAETRSKEAVDAIVKSQSAAY
jgi:hypothetical protein